MRTAPTALLAAAATVASLAAKSPVRLREDVVLLAAPPTTVLAHLEALGDGEDGGGLAAW